MPRMSARATAVFLAVIALLWVLLPRLRPATDDVSAVRQAEDRFELASARGDIRTLNQIIGSDFSTLDAGGNRETRSELLNRIRSDPWKVETLRQENLQIHFYGRTAVVSGADRIEARNAAGQNRTGLYRFLHIFQKRNGRWLLIAGLGPRLAVP